jgi:predicted DNA-binding antitoxin AbrB/MazE fold protein
MSQPIPAVFSSGVFRPLEPVELAEGTRAEVIPLLSSEPSQAHVANESTAWPPDYFAQTAGALSGENLDRPAQGELPAREGW